MSEKFNIRLKIAGKVFPLPIDRAKEEQYRRAEKEVNTLVDAFRRSYRAEAEEDYIAMAALQLAFNYVEMEMEANLEGEAEQLRQIERQLDAYLEEIK